MAIALWKLSALLNITHRDKSQEETYEVIPTHAPQEQKAEGDWGTGRRSL